ncbi:hypothetical protein QK292_14340 [Arthrobacter sp. AL08]|uniref:hypothetical protein n=1 Tax=unclassified Arthrobacter TaxID=235627 RepID=UPI00249CDBB6|nr:MULTISPECIES: hypothetical protein [unclassified Arthrobacter]MDI3242734.1 hypothetical protein [Arthrobacter sp. AL05]MDI3278745.1 hypothetical protein [Arthrobacter sp. AL08]
MRTAARAPFHALRSAMVALTILSLAAGAHTLAGGQLPVSGILLALLALTGLAATTATRLKLNLPALAGLLGAGQLLLHEAFTALSPQALGGSASGPAGPAAPHHLAAIPHFLGPELQTASSGTAAEAPFVSLLMLAGHALATLLCAVLLARGEDALWSLAAWLRPLLRLPAPVAPDVVAVPAVTGWPAECAPLPWRNLRRDSGRGPPAAVVVFS